jgi:hypothetical protein
VHFFKTKIRTFCFYVHYDDDEGSNRLHECTCYTVSDVKDAGTGGGKTYQASRFETPGIRKKSQGSFLFFNNSGSGDNSDNDDTGEDDADEWACVAEES